MQGATVPNDVSTALVPVEVRTSSFTTYARIVFEVLRLEFEDIGKPKAVLNLYR